MLSAKLLVLLSLQVLTVLGLGDNVLINLPELSEENLKWPQQKIQTIEYLLNTLTEVGNVTLVGWQNIWNSDGTLKEIRTIELTILTKISSENALYVDDVNVFEELPAVLDVKDTLSLTTGILLSGSIGQWGRDGSIITSLEVEPSSIQLKVIGENMIYWQQNLTATSLARIKSLVKTLLDESVLPVSVLHWNLDGTLNLQSSIIVPELLAGVVEAENASMPMLESALWGTAKGVLLQPDLIPTYVANYMKQNIPGYIWIVGEDMVGSWVNPGVYINVLYKVVDIGLQNIDLDIMGIKI